MEYDVYSTAHLMSASSCSWPGSAGEWVTDLLLFGFPAEGVRVYNSCGDRLFYSLSGAPSTKNDFLAGCSALVLDGLLPIGGIHLMTTATSCTLRPLVGVSAWRSA